MLQPAHFQLQSTHQYPSESHQQAALYTRPRLQVQTFALNKDKLSTLKSYNSATKHLTRWWTDRKKEAILHYPPYRMVAHQWNLTTELFANWILDMYAAGRSYSQVNQCRSALALHFATSNLPKEQWLTKSPLVKATLKAFYRNAVPGRKRFPIRGYILHPIAQAFFQLYPQDTAQLLTLALYMSYYCLLRVNELCSLQWQHMSWPAQHLSLYLGVTKGDQQARHPYYNTKEPSLLRMLTHIAAHCHPDPMQPVIPLSPAQLNFALHQALLAVSAQYPIPQGTFCTWHSLRHGRAVDLHLAGLSSTNLCQQGRWCSQAAANLYLYFTNSRHWPAHKHAITQPEPPPLP